MNKPSTTFASALVFGAASVWGLYWVPLRYLESLGVQGVWAVVMINLPAALVLTAVTAWQWKAHRGHMRDAIAIGVVTGLGLALYTSGLVYSSVMRVTLLFYLTPVWATLIGIFWLDEKAGFARWLAIAGGLIGLMFLVSGGGSVPVGIGDVFAFFSGIFWAAGAAMIKRFDKVPVAGMAASQFLASAIFAIVLGAVGGIIVMPDFAAVITGVPVSVAVSVIFLVPTLWMIFWAQKFLFPGRVGLLMMSEVFVAAISASIFIPTERMSVLEWTGAVVIIAACLVEIIGTPAEQTG